MSAVFSIYVGNIPARIHWRWIKALFGERLKVFDVFLSSKSGFKGTKYGFVRFLSLKEAEVAIKNFNGFRVLRRCLNVSSARERKPSQNSSRMRVKIPWTKKSSLPICSAFVEGDVCSDSHFTVEERKVWVKCFGLPCAFWNSLTLENMASLWGKLVSLYPANVNDADIYNACFQIQTKHIHRINDVISVVFGDHSFTVRVEEMCECYNRGIVCARADSGDRTLLSTPNKHGNKMLESSSAEKENSVVRLDVNDSMINDSVLAMLEEQAAFEDDPFGLDPIIKRLSKSRSKADRKAKANMVKNCTPCFVSSTTLESDSIQIEKESFNVFIEQDDVNLLENEGSDEMIGELPNYIDNEVVSYQAVGADGCPEIEANSGILTAGGQNQRRKMKFPDPRKSWEISKEFGCTANVSDEAMVERNKVSRLHISEGM